MSVIDREVLALMRDVAERMGLGIDLGAEVTDLSLADRQMVAIAREEGLNATAVGGGGAGGLRAVAEEREWAERTAEATFDTGED